MAIFWGRSENGASKNLALFLRYKRKLKWRYRGSEDETPLEQLRPGAERWRRRRRTATRAEWGDGDGRGGVAHRVQTANSRQRAVRSLAVAADVRKKVGIATARVRILSRQPISRVPRQSNVDYTDLWSIAARRKTILTRSTVHY